MRKKTTNGLRIEGGSIRNVPGSRYWLLVIGLTATYNFLVSLATGAMPFTSMPTWWAAIWPSRSLGVYTWFGILDACGAFVAAVPVALLLTRLIAVQRIRASFIIGLVTALIVGSSIVIGYPLSSYPSRLVTLTQLLGLLLSVPLLVWVSACRLQSKAVL